VAEEINTRSAENNSRREQDSGAKQIAEDDFDAVIIPRLRLGLNQLRSGGGRLGGGHQIFPQNPL
jgi:hypothetical protein